NPCGAFAWAAGEDGGRWTSATPATPPRREVPPPRPALPPSPTRTRARARVPIRSADEGRSPSRTTLDRRPDMAKITLLIMLGDPRLELPPPKRGDFLAAPGGGCENGHHGYPGGLSVHTLATLRHARALAEDYRHVYAVDVHTDQLTTAVIWQGALMAATLPF